MRPHGAPNGLRRRRIDRPRDVQAPRALVARRAVAQTHGCELRAELMPERPSASLDAPGSVTLRVTTDCTQPLKVTLSTSPHRPGFAQVSAVDTKGRPVPQEPPLVNDVGGASGLVDFGSAKPFEQRLVLSDFLKFTTPGPYELSVKHQLPVGKSRDDLEWITLNVSTPLELTP